MDRIATFKTFISRTPTDPFPRYGLAMEYKGRGDLEAAWTAFNELIEQFPDYVPTYLMAGGTLKDLGRKAEAADILARGVAAATKKSDTHAKKELEAALAEMLDG